MGKYSDRNKSAANAQAPKTINVSGDQSYEYRRDRGFVTMKYYFHGADWEYWASQMAAKDMTAEQMSYFIGATQCCCAVTFDIGFLAVWGGWLRPPLASPDCSAHLVGVSWFGCQGPFLRPGLTSPGRRAQLRSRMAWPPRLRGA